MEKQRRSMSFGGAPAGRSPTGQESLLSLGLLVKSSNSTEPGGRTESNRQVQNIPWAGAGAERATRGSAAAGRGGATPREKGRAAAEPVVGLAGRVPR